MDEKQRKKVRNKIREIQAKNLNASGSKYLRQVTCAIDGCIDVYAVLDAFEVTCPARQHAIKKLLCAGIRDELQDLEEAADAVTRAIQMAKARGDAMIAGLIKDAVT